MRGFGMGRWVLVLLLALGACVPAGRLPAELLAVPSPSIPATFQLRDRELQDGRFVGLAFSGGGSRSAVFAAAVMKELDRLTLLPQVDVLSAVSGGAIPAAAYALDGYRGLNFQNGFLEQIGQDFQQDLAGPWYSAPANLLRFKVTRMIPADLVIRVLDDKIFHGATFADLNPSRPLLLLNSTDALTGEPFVISNEAFASLHQPLASLSVARAVYMSAAYPGLMEPIPLYDGNANSGGADRPTLLIYDGGPADNLGIRTVMRVLDRAAAQRPMPELFPRGCLVIAVDATGRATDNREPMSAASVLLKSHRREVLELAGIPETEQDRAKFGTFSVGRNGSSGQCRFWHVALRHLPDSDPLGSRATRVKTSLALSPEDQSALTDAAVRLVREGKEEAERTGDLAEFLRLGPSARTAP
ncbi:MAG: patatin-like phospholipase family protein [Nitrospiraceae bacterium]|nr:patatin-like phospholipase family protein [Nitrospiraceae bacterium]